MSVISQRIEPIQIKFDYEGFNEYIPYFPSGEHFQYKFDVLLDCQLNQVKFYFNMPLNATLEQLEMFNHYMLYFKGVLNDIYYKFEGHIMDEITRQRMIAMMYEFQEYCDMHRLPSIKDLYNHCFGIKPYLPFTIGINK